MTKPIEDSANAAAIRTALGVPTNADLAAKYTKPANGIPAADLDADPAGRTLLTATSAAERKQVLGLDQVNNTSDASKPISTLQQLALDRKQEKAASGTIGAAVLSLRLMGYGMNNRPHTITVTPASGCTILVESSIDNGATYTTVGQVSAQATWDYDLTPGSSWVTHVRLRRTAGSATTSTFSIRG